MSSNGGLISGTGRSSQEICEGMGTEASDLILLSLG